MPIPFDQLADHLSESYSRLEITLRGHLWIEAGLNGLIEARMRYPEALSIDKMGFAQKTSLAHALGLIPPGDVGWFRKLNKVRNDLAHTLGGEPTDEDLKQLESTLSADTREMVSAVVAEAVGTTETPHTRLRSTFVVVLIFMELKRMAMVWRQDNRQGISGLALQRALARVEGTELSQQTIDEWRRIWDVPSPPRPGDVFDKWPPDSETGGPAFG